MAGLVDRIFNGTSWVASNCRLVHVVPSSGGVFAVVTAVSNFSGEAIADEYVLTFSDVDTVGNTAKVYVMPQSPNNPYRNVAGIDIIIDGSTIHSEVVPGIDLVFSASGSFSDTWSDKILIGVYQGTFNAFGDTAGLPGIAVRHQVLNEDSGAAADCLATLKVMSIQVRTNGIIFADIKPFADSATEKVLGGGSERVMPYHVTVANVTGVGASKVMDLSVDGSHVDVQNLSTGATTTSTGLNVVDRYKIASGDLISFEFKLSQSAEDSSTANVMIFQKRYQQIAPDVDGVAGAWGTSDVQLTQSGESAGVIQPTAVAYYWTRPLVPDGADGSSNPYPGNVFLVGKQTGTAGWVA